MVKLHLFFKCLDPHTTEKSAGLKTSIPLHYILNNDMLLICIWSLFAEEIPQNYIKFSDAYFAKYFSGLKNEDQNKKKAFQEDIKSYINNPTKFLKKCKKNPFLPLCAMEQQEKKRIEKRKLSLQHKKKSQRIFHDLKRFLEKKQIKKIFSLNLDENEDEKEGLQLLLKNIDKKEKLNFIIQHLNECSSHTFIFFIALKLEEYLPDEELKNKILSLYDKLSKKNNHQKYHTLATLRKAFFLLSDNLFQEAFNTLNTLNSVSQPDSINAKVLFWKHFCLRNLDQNLAAIEIAQKIKQQFPLSFYSIFIQMTENNLNIGKNETDEPLVFFRAPSYEHTLWNDRILLIELCLEMQKKRFAQTILNEYSSDLLNSSCPIEFKLYWAILLFRTESMVEGFSFLYSLAQQNEALVNSKKFLKILFPTYFLDHIKQHSTLLDPYIALSLMRQESGFNEKAQSAVHAYGLMQLQLPTARKIKKNVSTYDLFVPMKNISIGVQHLNKLFLNNQSNLYYALAAYNAGQSRVKKWAPRYNVKNQLIFTELLPVKETRDYIMSISKNFIIYKWIYENALPTTSLFGFLQHSHLKSDTVKITQ